MGDISDVSSDDEPINRQILACDTNYNLLLKNEHSAINDFYENLVQQGLSPHIVLPSRITCHSATLIDNSKKVHQLFWFSALRRGVKWRVQPKGEFVAN